MITLVRFASPKVVHQHRREITRAHLGVAPAGKESVFRADVQAPMNVPQATREALDYLAVTETDKGNGELETC